MELVKIGSVTPNPNNPRFIKNEKYKLLIDSIKQYEAQSLPGSKA